MKVGVTFSMDVEILDPQEFWDAANACYHNNNHTRDYDAVEIEFVDACGTREEPELHHCAQMLFDPGESPGGCQIHSSFAEEYAVA